MMVAAIAEQRLWQERLIIDAVEAASAAAFRTKIVVVALSLLTFGLALWVAWSLTRMISGAFARARAITERIADGDLSSEIYVKPGDEFGYLFASLANMQSSLVKVIGGVRRVAAQVTQAAQQIDRATDDLAAGTRTQSSALDGTAAATERITESARGSAASIGSVSTLAADASRVATEGGAVVTQVVQTMRGIDDSSRRISEIVNVIDGIAFQTNILALNAAVEAARAGEQGRGFAVVASEVRNLAQRSAAAAREVKALISESAGRVQTGSALVQQAGETMSAIVTSVQQVTDLMGGLAASAREQSDGVASVNAAIGEIDRAARSNAERVDRSQVAAAALREHAQALEAAVAAFRIDTAANRSAERGRVVPAMGAWAAA
jgi:methyl-accepting chemotaxis protein